MQTDDRGHPARIDDRGPLARPELKFRPSAIYIKPGRIIYYESQNILH